VKGPENDPADLPGTQGVPAELKGPEAENAVLALPLFPDNGPEWEDEAPEPLERRDDELVRPPGLLELLAAVLELIILDELSTTGMLSILPSSPDFLMSPPV
jgi:hypothetical protein